MKRWRWLLLLVPAAGLLACLMSLRDLDADMKGDWAVSESVMLIKACRAYAQHPDNGGEFPETLDNLVRPPFGGRPFVESNTAAVYDPWGHPYRYSRSVNDAGEWEIAVWAEHDVGGRVRKVGARRRAGGGIETFGVSR